MDHMGGNRMEGHEGGRSHNPRMENASRGSDRDQIGCMCPQNKKKQKFNSPIMKIFIDFQHLIQSHRLK